MLPLTLLPGMGVWKGHAPVQLPSAQGEWSQELALLSRPALPAWGVELGHGVLQSPIAASCQEFQAMELQLASNSAPHWKCEAAEQG